MSQAGQITKKKVFANAVWNLFGFVLAVGITFVMCPILLRSLGDARYGVWSLVETTVAYFALLDLGIGAAVVRYVSKFEALEDRGQLNRIFSTTLSTFGLLALFVAGVCGIAALVWARPLGVPEELATDTRWLLLLLGGSVAVELVGGVYGAVLIGLNNFPAKVSIEAGLRVVTAILQLVVIRAGGDIVGLALLGFGGSVLKALLAGLVSHRCLPSLRFSLSLVRWETLRMLGGYSLQAFVILVAGRISYRSDALVIGAFLAPACITYFVTASRLIEYAKSVVSVAVNALTPAISALDAQGNRQAVRRGYLEGARYVLFLLLPVQMGILFLGGPFLSLWLGPHYAAESYATLAILAVPLGLQAAQSVSSRMLYGIGAIAWLARLAVIQAVINLGMSVALVVPFGIEGVAWGTTIPAIGYSLAGITHTCRLLEISFGQFLSRAVLKPFGLSLILAAGWLGLQQFSPPLGWGSLLATGFSGVVIYWQAAVLLELGPRRTLALGRQLARRASAFVRSRRSEPSPPALCPDVVFVPPRS
jgi:O-antigen/teichoic acid export membrane protein